MAKKKRRGTNEHEIRNTIRLLIANNHPGCSAEFVGDPRGNMRRRTFGFRIVDANGKYRTEVIWVGPSFYSRPNKTWLLKEVRRARERLAADNVVCMAALQ